MRRTILIVHADRIWPAGRRFTTPALIECEFRNSGHTQKSEDFENIGETNRLQSFDRML